MTAAPAVETKGLIRQFGSVRALDGFDVSLPAGRIVALVGPNGAGKTTLLLILAGLLAPDRGTTRVGGYDPVSEPYEVHRATGWMPDFFGTYDALTAREYLDLFAAAYEVSNGQRSARTSELLSLVALEKQADVPVHTLSRGQKQRLGFARSIVHAPPILLLDEPASGLDPVARIHLRDLLIQQREQGVSILVSSHILSELEEIADLVAFVDRGRCTGIYPIDELPAAQEHRRWLFDAIDRARLMQVLIEAGLSPLEGPNGIEIAVADTQQVAAIVGDLVRRDVALTTSRELRADLESTFLAMSSRDEA
jgi:ABC-2 type transport system ATP-binding protein